MVRVLHVAESGKGGVPAFIRRLCEGLGDDVEFGIVCPPDSDLVSRPPDNTAVYPVEIPHQIRPFGDRKAAQRVAEIVEAGGYDVVHLNSTKAGVLGIWLRGKLPATSTIFTPHALRSHAYGSGSPMRPIALFVEGRICGSVDVVAACSAAEAQSVDDAKLASGEKLKMVDNGVDLEALSAPSLLSREEIGVPEDAFVAGTVGRLSPQKDPQTFIRAARRISEEAPEAHFVIVGDGPLEGALREMAEGFALSDRVHLLGWRDDAGEVLKLFDVFVMTSRYEGGSFTVLEAAAARRPIVAAASPGVGVLIDDGVSGILTGIGDDTAIAEAVLRLARDAKMAETLAANAFETIAWPRRLEVMVDGWGSLYRSLLEEPAPGEAVQRGEHYPA